MVAIFKDEYGILSLNTVYFSNTERLFLNVRDKIKGRNSEMESPDFSLLAVGDPYDFLYQRASPYDSSS